MLSFLVQSYFYLYADFRDTYPYKTEFVKSYRMFDVYYLNHLYLY